MAVQIHPSWQKVLQTEFDKDYFKQIVVHLKAEKAQGKMIYPAGQNIFNAFNLTPFENVKVVLIGQDPYHGKGQAHGLSFSVQKGIKPPPSLINIFKEIQSDTGVAMPANTGDLTQWAQQGVLLLNASLTVRANEPNSHANLGWHIFTNAVIEKISDLKEDVVFLLWGKFAQQKQELINETKHKVFRAAHPSPYAADKGFFGCRHFSKTNEFLASHGKQPINWKLEIQE